MYVIKTWTSFGNLKMDANEGVQSFNFEVGQKFKSFKEFESQLKHYQDAKFIQMQGRVQNIKLGGDALKKIAPSGISCEKSLFYAQKFFFFQIAEGGAKIFGVFRVKNHDFTPKNHIFFQF